MATGIAELKKWIEPALAPGEQLLWAGQPIGAKVPTEPDLAEPPKLWKIYLTTTRDFTVGCSPMIAVLIGIFGLAVAEGFFAGFKYRPTGTYLCLSFAALPILCCILAPLLLVFTTHEDSWDRYKRRKTYGDEKWYALTSQRALCCENAWVSSIPSSNWNLAILDAATVQFHVTAHKHYPPVNDSISYGDDRDISYERWSFTALPNTQLVFHLAQEILQKHMKKTS